MRIQEQYQVTVALALALALAVAVCAAVVVAEQPTKFIISFIIGTKHVLYFDVKSILLMSGWCWQGTFEDGSKFLYKHVWTLPNDAHRLLIMSWTGTTTFISEDQGLQRHEGKPSLDRAEVTA